MPIENRGHKFHLPLTPETKERLEALHLATGLNKTKIVNAILADKDVFQPCAYCKVNTLLVELLRQCCKLKALAESSEPKFNVKERKELLEIADFYKRMSLPLDQVILPNLKKQN